MGTGLEFLVTYFIFLEAIEKIHIVLNFVTLQKN